MHDSRGFLKTLRLAYLSRDNDLSTIFFRDPEGQEITKDPCHRANRRAASFFNVNRDIVQIDLSSTINQVNVEGD